jgi:hypothetical protein
MINFKETLRKVLIQEGYIDSIKFNTEIPVIFNIETTKHGEQQQGGRGIVFGTSDKGISDYDILKVINSFKIKIAELIYKNLIVHQQYFVIESQTYSIGFVIVAEKNNSNCNEWTLKIHTNLRLTKERPFIKKFDKQLVLNDGGKHYFFSKE